jgi:hypothetical protein
LAHKGVGHGGGNLGNKVTNTFPLFFSKLNRTAWHVNMPGRWDGRKKKLAEICLLPLAQLLVEKNLRMVYNKMVQAIVKESNTRNVFGMWKDEEFVSIVDLFHDKFAEQGIKVVLCKRKSGSGAFCWLEFMNLDVASNYVLQYDVENHSGQVVKTIYTTLEFP